MAYADPHDERLKAARRRHYNKNKEAYMTRARRVESDMRKYIIELKSASSCMNCGISYPDEPWLMEFDHREQSDKIAAIGRIVGNGSWKQLLTEIEKCDILCVVCHRRRTAKQLGWEVDKMPDAVLE